MALPGVAEAVATFEFLMHVVTPEDITLLLPDLFELRAQPIDKAQNRVAEKRQNIPAGFAGAVKLAVILGAS